MLRHHDYRKEKKKKENFRFIGFASVIMKHNESKYTYLPL